MEKAELMTKEFLSKLLSDRGVISEEQASKIVESTRVINNETNELDVFVEKDITDASGDRYNSYTPYDDCGNPICTFSIYEENNLLDIENIEEMYEVY